ncbi:VOC family protein [Salinispora sp. H7-4]|uniref:VOC family protein n=1 Tax=Salinispora sp. H7-4 TaxID=2748321 RepID=UPI00035D52B6|nr:VOC family protein [Salinispora sp. H7-4]NYT94865.1 VOC family protein [Salinispora sp. H7-4]
MTSQDKVGTIAGFDLTVQNADGVRDFYADVVGWKPEPLSMGAYDDYMMLAQDGNPVAGICHAKSSNADLPPQWITYIAVSDLSASLARVTEKGGEVVRQPNGTGPGGFALIKDPAGAVVALMQNPHTS